jgi:outer membrane protein assembly factor BamB
LRYTSGMHNEERTMNAKLAINAAIASGQFFSKPVTREIIEQALADGRVYAAMSGGKWWALRRNGKTQTWKTRPGEFRIPVKAGLRSCGEITDLNMADTSLFRIVV